MILFLHIIIAVSSIVCATYGLARPTTKNLQLGHALIAMTFTSGLVLAWSEPAHLLRTCLSGITYLAVVTVGVFLTRRKLTLIQQLESRQI